MRFFVIVLTATIGLLAGPLPVNAQVPVSSAQTLAAADTLEADQHTPRGALWRAAVLPGWGQYYNRQYLKIPVVYGALGGLTALALTFNQHYLTYRHAYLYQAYAALVEQGKVESHPYPDYQSDYNRLIARTGSLPTSTLRDQRDKLRRNRDLTYISIGVAYGLSIVDAYVSAHLADFNVSDDLSVQLYPTGSRWCLRITANW